MKITKDSSLCRLQSAFLAIVSLGILALVLGQAKPLASTILVAMIILVAATNLIQLRKLANEADQS
ncbi:hypothetical protein HZY93_04880 [Streptococcus danieliae]|uniref:Uncharacterized protein n=1 Tax=Streptococcus danieliae TaxID=747656 RepID=A0A7Z0LDG2_9STRE|nr:hypothetical protein [Streptococcus danieliae]MBF0717378.1 hypothetical protein [Streptococcus danieliae]NYS49308.1 hypothetical protein [Streptococcus danieliae]